MRINAVLILIFSFSCISEKERDVPSFEFPQLAKEQIYFSKSERKFVSEYFEKDSGFTKFLIFSFKNKVVQVKEIEISVTSYSDEFLKSVNNVLPGKPPKKFKVMEIIRSGIGEERKNPSGIQVDYNSQSMIEAEGNVLSDVIKNFPNKKGSTTEYQETIFYLRSGDGTYWKGLEFITRANNELMVWKNSQGGSSMDYAYTEFSPKKNVIEYSRIFSYSNYKYKPLSIEDDYVSGSIIFRDLNYQYFYSPLIENETALTKAKPENISFKDSDGIPIQAESYRKYFPFIILKSRQ